MCKVSPLGASSGIKWALSSVSKQTFWMKFAGAVTIPCCCLGLAFCTGGAMLNIFKDKYEEVVRIYGKGNLDTLASKVRQEKQLFRAAVTKVNNEVHYSSITEVNLIEVMRSMVPRFGQIYNSTTFTSILRLHHTHQHEQYYKKIWDEYQNTGGNFHVVIYGLIEYLCTEIDPTCTMMEDVLNKFTADSSLRAECMSHKVLAGF